jgi:hypothetical protein
LSNHSYKQVDELTIADLEKFPVWEYLSEDDPYATDECTVKGYEKHWETVDGEFFVKAKFIFNDGTVYFGHVKPERSLSSSQPVIIIGNDKVLVWHGVMKPTRTTLKSFYKLLNKKVEDVFPITWHTDVELGVVNTGLIEGFGYYNNVMDSFDDIIQLIT